MSEPTRKMKGRVAPPTTLQEELTKALGKARADSLKASERGDFKEVARLTLETARLNQQLAVATPKVTEPLNLSIPY